MELVTPPQATTTELSDTLEEIYTRLYLIGAVLETAIEALPQVCPPTTANALETVKLAAELVIEQAEKLDKLTMKI